MTKPRFRSLQMAVLAAAVSLGLAAARVEMATAGDAAAGAPPDYELPFGGNPFAPSNARMAEGGFLAQSDFIPAARCATCHPSTHAEWNESAHRNSFREPFYQVNVKHLIRDRGIAVTRHCESCHNPVALFSGALSAKATIDRPFDEEGVTCSVCHSIESADTRGIGSYVLARPALIVRADGQRVREATSLEIFSDLEGHRRAVMRPLLKTPEFCAACHKAAVVPELNGRKWLRSFAIYDEWQQSAFSNEAVQPLSTRDRQTCQSCHMPASANSYALHRWPGANTAIPAFYGWPEQIEATRRLLRSGAVSVDIFALRTGPAASAPIAPLDAAAPAVVPGARATVDVVVANQGVGHSFPAELRDIFEAWLEFSVTDAAGRVIYHSGAVRPDGSLEASAHAYRATPVDDRGQPITRHDIWNTRITALDRHIPAGRADLGRFSFVVPADAQAPLTLVAKLNYRRFNRRFNDWVAREFPVGPAPVVEMAVASAELRLAGAAEAAAPGNAMPQDAAALRKRWRAYGVALFDQQHYEAAVDVFERALALAAAGSADEAASSADLAMALLRAERTGRSQETFGRAERALGRALAIAPGQPRALFLRALLRTKSFRYTEALADFVAVAQARPRDRHVWTQMASLLLLQRRDREAQAAYERVLDIDPDDNEAHLKLAGLYWRFGLPELARREQDAYQARHTDTVGETLRRDYLRAHPELYTTWAWREFGDNPIGSAP